LFQQLLFDWMGEFNSYFAPFSLFGSVAVVGRANPVMPGNLSRSKKTSEDRSGTAEVQFVAGTINYSFGDIPISPPW